MRSAYLLPCFCQACHETEPTNVEYGSARLQLARSLSPLESAGGRGGERRRGTPRARDPMGWVLSSNSDYSLLIGIRV